MGNWLNFSIGPGLDPHWLSCFKLLHYYHLLLCRANAAWDIEKTKWSRPSCKGKFFFYLAVSVLNFLLLVMLRSNSRLQIFFKTDVLKNFAIFTGKHLCWSCFLIKFQYWRPAFLFKKRLQHRNFYVNIAKFLRTAFL